MKSRIADFKKVSSGESDGKMVVMKDDTMMIKTEHYKDIKNRCIKLEKTGEGVKWWAGHFGSREKFKDDQSGKLSM